MTWYRKAAEQGNVRAITNIGFLYNDGLGVRRDYSMAATWYRTAAQHGHIKAQVYQSTSVCFTKIVAMAWYTRAADTGDSEVQKNIGYPDEQGLGVAQDYAKAMNWYRKAAAQGNAQAERNIGSLYEKGRGVPQDPFQAEAWYKKGRRSRATCGWHSPSSGDLWTESRVFRGGENKAKFEGTYVLSLVVGADGNTRDVKVVRSLGKGLDEKAIDAINTWKFEPGTKDGVPVAIQIQVEVEFHLK